MVGDAEVSREPQSLKEEFSGFATRAPIIARRSCFGRCRDSPANQSARRYSRQTGSGWDGWQVYRSDHGIL